MALVIADRVLETSATTGTGSFSLAGAASGFQSFNSAIGNGNTTYYTIECPTTGEWEVGLGTFTAPSTLARTTVYSSSNSGSAVNFSAGPKNVFVDMSATKWTNGVLGVANGGTGTTTSTGTGSVVLATAPTLAGATLSSALTYGGVTLSNSVTGTGSMVLSTSPVLTMPNLGTPSAAILTNATGLPLSTGVTGTLAVANGGTGVTTSTGTGNNVLADNPTLTGGGTITANNPIATLTQTWNNAAVTFTGLLVNVTNTSSNSGSKLLDLQVGGTSQFSVSRVGAVTAAQINGSNIFTGGSGVLGWAARARMYSPADSQIQLTNAAATDFSLLQFGGATSSFPAMKRNAASLNFRLADDSADAGITAGTATFSGALTYGGVTLSNSVTGTGSMVLSAAPTFTSAVTFSGSTSTLAASFTNIAETATVSATAATGTINYDITTQSVLYYTTNASANWTVNFRASSGTSLNTAMAIGQAVTVVFLVTQGATAYYNNAVTIDGNSITPKYQGGTAWSAGNASSVDAYTYVIVKTGNAAFTVFASQTRFA